MRVTCADLTKAQRLLGYRPTVELLDGVREFVEWYRAVITSQA
jgi:nucleoside-diphosphate-sugar epimerase